MIEAQHHTIMYPLFEWLTRFLIHREFNTVTCEGEFADTGKPVLVIANHVSWWDGFWVEYLNQKVLKRGFYFMMLEEQLKKHWYFRYTGGFSIKKKSRSALESIKYSRELLQHAENMVLIFPQGEICSMHRDVLTFEKGIERILERIAPETQVVFVANVLDYFSDKKPNVWFYFKSFGVEQLRETGVEKEYNAFYRQCLNSQKVKTS